MFANPRQVALAVLDELDKGQETLDALMERAFRKHFTLERRDRALTMELVYGVLRQRARLDWVIGQFSKTPREKIEPLVQNVLRLGIYQLFYMDRVPPSAAVNESVNLVKVNQPEWIARFVNGVLRAVERGREDIKWPDPKDDLPAWLAVETSHPLWLVERWTGRYGADAARDLCESNNKMPVLTIRANTLRLKRDQLLQFLRKEVPAIVPAFYSPEGLILKGFSGNVSDLTGYKTGWFQVQDESSQLVSHLVSPQPGELILDACAGLGGKTTHLAQMMRNLGRILALDIHGGRLERLKENAIRLGIQNIEVIKKDVMQSLAGLGGKKFDRILVDAPCTGLGVIRRNPDIKWRRKPEDLPIMAERQGRLLDEVAPLLKPGGFLVYATCSLEPEENEEVIKNFLVRHPDFEIEDPGSVLPQKAGELVEDNFLRTYPHRHGTDGFTAVRMKKRAESR
ncbi:MAG: 16S rRNA (cytosine(967)-C(5))-methyltransferase RsmB [Deltaproteobacteria bacterium]|nr:16S rRNA (cytosine(967)-C(5))-methyltransferase RsmB [Deltaproteobacteria bacterium]